MPSNGFNKVLKKYKRAKKHIDDFEVALAEFRKGEPYTISKQTNEKAGYVVYVIDKVPVIPDELALILGDAFQNLRSALDHLAHELVIANGKEPTTQTGFPIFDTPKLYHEGAPTKVKGMNKYAKEAIDRLQPYKSGDAILWQIH